MSGMNRISEWLESKSSTVWGRGFNIDSESSRRKAAEWFQQQVEDFYTFNSGIPIQIRDESVVDELRSQVEHLKGVAYCSQDGARSWRDVSESQRLTIAEVRGENERLRMELASRPVCP